MRVLGVLVVIALLFFSIWFYFKAPCSDMKYLRGSSIPGRCLVLKN